MIPQQFFYAKPRVEKANQSNERRNRLSRDSSVSSINETSPLLSSIEDSVYSVASTASLDHNQPNLARRRSAVNPEEDFDEYGRRSVWMSCNFILKKIDMHEETFRICGEIHFFWQDANVSTINRRVTRWTIEDDCYGVNLPLDPNIVFEDFDWFQHTRAPKFSFNEKTSTVGMHIYLDAALPERMELERFPLDRQFFNIQVKIRDRHWILEEECPSWVSPPWDNLFSARLNDAVLEYTMIEPWITYDNDTNACVTFRLRCERNTDYFIGHIIIPTFLIVLACFCTYGIAPTLVSNRLTVIVTLMLSAVAFRSVALTQLPRISYFTFMDYYLVFAFFMIVTFLLENAIAGNLKAPLDHKIDVVFYLGMGVVWISTHVLIVTALKTEWGRIPWNAVSERDEADESVWFHLQNLRAQVNKSLRLKQVYPEKYVE